MKAEKQPLNLGHRQTIREAAGSPAIAVFEPATRKKKLWNISVQPESFSIPISCVTRPRCRKLFLNILGNSVEYTPDRHGNISLTDHMSCHTPNSGLWRLLRYYRGRYRNWHEPGISAAYLRGVYQRADHHRDQSCGSRSWPAHCQGPGRADERFNPRWRANLAKVPRTTIVHLSFPDCNPGCRLTLDQQKRDCVQAELKGYQGKRILLAEDNDLNAEIADNSFWKKTDG